MRPASGKILSHLVCDGYTSHPLQSLRRQDFNGNPSHVYNFASYGILAHFSRVCLTVPGMVFSNPLSLGVLEAAIFSMIQSI